MPATVIVNKLTVVHKSSGGVLMTFPDVCKTPSPAGPIPIPYPNVAQSSDTADGSTTVTMDGNPIMLKSSNFMTSTGDEAGSAMGVASNKIKGKAYPKTYSFDVKAEGQNVFRLTDIMLANGGSPTNTPPAGEVQAPDQCMARDPEPLKVKKLEWNKTEGCCGDEVELKVETESFSGEIVPVTVARQPDERPIRGNEIVEMNSNSETVKWVILRGPWSRDVKLEARQNVWNGVRKSSNAIEVKVPGDAVKPVVREETAWVYKAKEDGAGKLVLDAAGKKIYVHDPRSWAQWNVHFEMEVKSGKFTVTKKVHFISAGGAVVTKSKKRSWKRHIEGVWNQYKLHRKNCKRGKDCSCGGWSRGCCMFPIKIVCEFAPGHGKPVTLHKGKNDPEGYKVTMLLPSGAPNPDYPAWWYSHHWWEGLANVPATVRAHEFGHLIGMYDEYPAGAVELSRIYADVPDSIMNAGAKIYPRHMEEFKKWFEDHAKGVIGDLELLAIRP